MSTKAAKPSDDYAKIAELLARAIHELASGQNGAAHETASELEKLVGAES